MTNPTNTPSLYTLGTLLTTRRLSLAALYVELFGEENIGTVVLSGLANYGPSTKGHHVWEPGFYPNCDGTVCCRVTVTPENQAFLSPVPMVGDYIHFKRLGFGFWVGHITSCGEVFQGTQPNVRYASIDDQPVIEKRTYPNGQRAPLIEWDSVQLPREVV
jgi:hypothetical protein